MEVHGLPGLLHDFPAWKIELNELGNAWLAVKREGRSLHVLAAYDVDELRAKLEKLAEEERHVA
jgi:hypothetical protein